MSVTSARTRKKTSTVTVTATRTRGGAERFRVRARGAGAPDLRTVVPSLVGALGGVDPTEPTPAGRPPPRWCPNSGTYASLAERAGRDEGRAGCGHCGRALKLRKEQRAPAPPSPGHRGKGAAVSGAHESEGVVWLLSPLDALHGASVLARALAPSLPLRLGFVQHRVAARSGRCS